MPTPCLRALILPMKIQWFCFPRFSQGLSISSQFYHISIHFPPWFYHGDSSTKTRSCIKHGTLVLACVVIMSMTWRNNGTPAKTWGRASVGPALCHILANVWYTISHPYFTIWLTYQLQDIRCLVPTVPLLSSFSHILSVRPPVYCSAKPKGSICLLVK